MTHSAQQRTTKLAYYKAAENFGYRGTFSTGFKAPTPGQSNAKKVSTVFNSVGDQLMKV